MRSGFVNDFLDGYGEEFGQYIYDDRLWCPQEIMKFAGQLCYLSLGEKRTKNKDAGKYFQHLIESGHGSVLEHVNCGFLFWGVSRSFTHEIVRHRVGTAFSQVSQRYVGADKVRFVERPEYQKDLSLHWAFESRIDATRAAYEDITEELLKIRTPVEHESKTDARKAVQQAARSVLPNETEAPILVTANIRAWRGIIDQRLTPHAEPEIRTAILRVFLQLYDELPEVFSDYRLYRLPDGTIVAETKNRKV